MPTFTVHAPPPRKGETTLAPERFVFVRDGFHVWAFLLTPLWLLARRLWLGFIGYVVLTVVFGVALRLFGAPRPVTFLVGLAIALLFGFEAATLRRWKLSRRRGWRVLGVVVGEDRESAERRFFGEWIARAPEAPPREAAPARPPAPPEVIGLFPEPGATR